MPLELHDALASQQGIEKTKKISPDEIPIIDVGPLIRGEVDGAARIAAQFTDAFTTILRKVRKLYYLNVSGRESRCQRRPC